MSEDKSEPPSDDEEEKEPEESESTPENTASQRSSWADGVARGANAARGKIRASRNGTRPK